MVRRVPTVNRTEVRAPEANSIERVQIGNANRAIDRRPMDSSNAATSTKTGTGNTK